MQYMLHCHDHENAVEIGGTVNHPLFGETEVFGYDLPLMRIGLAELPDARFEVGQLILTDGILARHTTVYPLLKAVEIDLSPLLPFIERFFAGQWNTPPTEEDMTDGQYANDAAIERGATGAFIWDAFTCGGERYNIVCYLGQQTTVMLASEY